MNAKKLNKILYFLIFGIILVTGLVSAFFIINLNKKSIQVANDRYMAVTSGKKIEALSNLQLTYQGLKTEEDNITEYLPSEKDVSGIIAELEEISNENSLHFEAYVSKNSQKTKVQKGKKVDLQLVQESGYSSFSVELDLIGGFENINKFIKAIESNSRLLNVEEIRIDRESTQVDSSGTVRATLMVKAYLK